MKKIKQIRNQWRSIYLPNFTMFNTSYHHPLIFVDYLERLGGLGKECHLGNGKARLPVSYAIFDYFFKHIIFSSYYPVEQLTSWAISMFNVTFMDMSPQSFNSPIKTCPPSFHFDLELQLRTPSFKHIRTLNLQLLSMYLLIHPHIIHPSTHLQTFPKIFLAGLCCAGHT